MVFPTKIPPALQLGFAVDTSGLLGMRAMGIGNPTNDLDIAGHGGGDGAIVGRSEENVVAK